MAETGVAAPDLAELEAAAARLRPVLVRTPLVPLHGHDDDGRILLKLEIHQAVGCFKTRGVYHAVSRLSPAERARGLSTVSAGNTAKALAWCGRRFGVPARSLMPESAPATKIEAVERYGATPVLVPTAEVFRYLKEHGWEDEPYAFIHPWTNRDVMLGHGSMGLEILDDCPAADAVYVPVGGGGLLGGVGSALKASKPGIRIIAVEPAGCPALSASLAADRPTSVDCRTMCDGVAVPYITDEMFPLLRSLVDDVALVSEDDVRATIRALVAGNHIVAAGSGALAVAAATARRTERDTTSVCIVSGGSIDAATLADILAA